MLGMPIRSLTQGAVDRMCDEHEAWLRDHRAGRRMVLKIVDISGLEVQGRDMSRCRLKYCDASRTCFTATAFSDSLLKEIDLCASRLDNCTFVGSRLTDLTCERASLVETSYEDVKFSRVSFRNSVLVSATFWSTHHLSRTVFSLTDFREATLIGATFDYVIFKSADFRGADLSDAVFRKVDLRGAKFDDAKLTGARFEETYGLTAEDLEALIRRAK